jgi:predicted Zn finger-like uncharacterized protein
MPITVECSGCRKQYRVDPRAAGKKVRCKNCGNAFTVAPPPPSPASDEQDPLEALAAMERSAAPLEAPAFSLPASITPAAQALPSAYAGNSLRQVNYVPARPRTRYGRNRNRSGAVGTDTATPWFIIGYVAAEIISAIVMTVKAGDAPPENHRKMMELIWSVATLELFLYFVVLGPAVYLGAFITSKIFGFPMVELPYLRGCGVAAVPGLMLALAALLPWNPVLFGVILTGIIPVTFLALKFVFDLDWVGALVAFAFAGIFYSAAQVAAKMLLIAAIVASVLGGRGANSSNVAMGNDRLSSSFDSGQGSRGNSASSSRSEPQIDLAAQRLESLRERLTEAGNQPDDRSREQLTAASNEFGRELESLRAAKGAGAAFMEVTALLTNLKARAASAPSENPVPEINQPPSATETWTAAGLETELGEDTRYKQYALRPPRIAPLDLRSSEDDPAGLGWEARGRGFGRISISTVSRRNPSQMRVWTPDKPFMLSHAGAANVYWVDATNASVSYGSIGGMPFTRIASDPTAERSGRRWVKYVGLDGDHWVVMQIAAPVDDGQMCQLMEASARTFHRVVGNAPKADPFSAAAMVPRLADDPEHAAMILRRKGHAAEEPLLDGMNDSNHQVRQQCATLLGDLGTARSLPALKEAARSEDRSLADAARNALHQLDPKRFNAVTDAMIDLESGNWIAQKGALDRLAAMSPDEANRAAVVERVTRVLLDRKAAFTEEGAAKVLIAWAADNKVVPDLLSLLNERGDAGRRHAAMHVLAHLKDRRAVLPILHWLMLDPEPTIESLKQFGSVAEADVAVHLRNRDGKVRLSAARILAAIGTPRSYEALNRAAHDPRDLGAKDAAQEALDAIKERNPVKRG